MPIKKLKMPVEQWIKVKEISGRLFDDRGRFIGGEQRIEILQAREHLQEIIQRSEEEPVPAPIHGEVEWFFKGYVYDVSDIKDRYNYNDEQIQLLILEDYDKERRKFERLRRLYKSEDIQRESQQRERIPEHVRIAVWRRDGGKCVRCGSRENLEYDHIIPVSKGGSNTARNIELLCERCNREKRDRIE
jgi:hypothetical protein